MNERAHWLSAFAALMHLAIGLADPLRLPLRPTVPPSWQVIYMLLPSGFDWTYPALWTLTGLVMLAGVRWPGALRWGFRMSSLLFLSWAVAGVPAIAWGLGGNVQGAGANLYIAGVLWLVSFYVGVGERSDRIDVATVRLAEKVEESDGHA